MGEVTAKIRENIGYSSMGDGFVIELYDGDQMIASDVRLTNWGAERCARRLMKKYKKGWRPGPHREPRPPRTIR